MFDTTLGYRFVLVYAFPDTFFARPTVRQISLPRKMSEVADFSSAPMMLIFSLVIVCASALRLGVPTGAGSAALRTRASSRTCGQPHMGLAVGDQFPAEALKSFGVSGKKAVVFFYGADDAPSCKKELAAFDEFMDDFKSLGATVVGVRNAAGAKGADEVYSSMKIVVGVDKREL